MTASRFRTIALGFREAIESSHMDHPDFRVNNKIFASLNADETWAVVKLTPEQQAIFIQAEPVTFQPETGTWGKRGYTRIILKLADSKSVTRAVSLAWQNTAPRRLIEQERAR